MDDFDENILIHWADSDEDMAHSHVGDIAHMFITKCEDMRQEYLKTKNKKVWKELIRWTPEAWLQKRTVTLDYENLLAMCSISQRRNHKLNEWSGIDNSELENFIAWARTLPYAQELIFIDETIPFSEKVENSLLKIGIKIRNTDKSYRNINDIVADFTEMISKIVE